MSGRWHVAVLLLAALGSALGFAPATAQDAHVMAPADSIEERFRSGTFNIIDDRGSRFEGDRTSRVVLSFEDGALIAAKWATAPRGGEEYNNNPRYEVAAYELQKLFLDEPDYVVPPTVVRAVPLDWYRRLVPTATPTFPGGNSILVTLQYWLFNVTGGDVWDGERFARDTAFARHLGDFNILTYLIRHNDSNEGNYLISRTADNPRVFSVDNGISFSSDASNRGAEWRRLRLDRLPASTVERLRALSEDDVARQLETVAEYRVGPDGQLEAVPFSANTDPNRGVRRNDDTIQLGLTRSEIRGVWRRLNDLLRDVASGRIDTF